MAFFIIVLLNSLLTQVQHSFYSLNPAVVEVIKVLFVSFGWIGGLAWFMLRKDRLKQQSNS